MGGPPAWLHLLPPPYQHQHITRFVSRMFERRLYGMEEILLAAGLDNTATAPAARARARTSPSAYAVTKMIGMPQCAATS